MQAYSDKIIIVYMLILIINCLINYLLYNIIKPILNYNDQEYR
jgi:hypothetical protein